MADLGGGGWVWLYNLHKYAYQLVETLRGLKVDGVALQVKGVQSSFVAELGQVLQEEGYHRVIINIHNNCSLFFKGDLT